MLAIKMGADLDFGSVRSLLPADGLKLKNSSASLTLIFFGRGGGSGRS
jgi:hypothetical protein